jgi:hypothetical protein
VFSETHESSDMQFLLSKAEIINEIESTFFLPESSREWFPGRLFLLWKVEERPEDDWDEQQGHGSGTPNAPTQPRPLPPSLRLETNPLQRIRDRKSITGAGASDGTEAAHKPRSRLSLVDPLEASQIFAEIVSPLPPAPAHDPNTSVTADDALVRDAGEEAVETVVALVELDLAGEGGGAPDAFEVVKGPGLEMPAVEVRVAQEAEGVTPEGFFKRKSSLDSRQSRASTVTDEGSKAEASGGEDEEEQSQASKTEDD